MANIQNNKLKLEKHQEKAYQNVEKLFEEKGKAAVIFPTGCGKSFVVLKYILEHPDERILFLSPRNAIKDQMYEYIVRFIGGDFRPIEEIQAESGSIKQAAKQYIPNIECMLYQTIMGLGEKDSVDEVIKKLKPDLIVVDEMHHLKTKKNERNSQDITDEDEIADDITDEEETIENEDRINQENKWGQKFKRLLELNPQAKLLGLSATPIRNDGANVVERIFEDAIAEELSLLEAIEAGIIYPPKYVVPDFIREDELESLLEKINSVEGERKEELKAEYDELVKKADKAKGIPDLLKENITENDGKYIIFCKDIEDMKEKMSKAKEWFGEIDNEPEIYGINSKDSTSSRQLQDFNNSNSKHLKLMYCVGMIDEGVHLNNVSGVILAAKTGSRPTYLQRIGRAISSGKDKRQALVIDLVNNNEILADEHNTQYGYEISDLEALEKLVDWIDNKNDGKLPEYAEGNSTKENAMARRLARINNKYLKYVQNLDLLEELNEASIDEIQEILQLGKTIGMFEDVITIDFENGSSNGVDISINNFLHGIEIKGVRRDFREILDHNYFDISINMRNYEEYKAWCEEHGKLPRTGIKVNGVKVEVAKEGEDETEEQKEQRLGRARNGFYQRIKEKEELTSEEEKIKRLYEELDEQYKKEESNDMQKYEEYKAWCEKHGKKPKYSRVKENEIEISKIKQNKIVNGRNIFFNKIKRKAKKKYELTKEETEIKRLYEELDKQYNEESIDMQNYEEYKAWCEEQGKKPQNKRTKAAKKGEKETEEQRETRLSNARNSFNQKIKEKKELTNEEEKIKILYEELDEQYKEKSIDMQNYEEYKAWCEEQGKKPQNKRTKAAKKGEKETEEQRETRLSSARNSFNQKIKEKEELTSEEEKIKRLYEELDEQYKKEESNDMQKYEEYKAWCEEQGKKPQQKGVKAAKKGEKETAEQREHRLSRARHRFYQKIKEKKELTKEEEEIKKLYEVLDELYGRKQPAKNIAHAVKNVSIDEVQEAEEFMETITNEKDKRGVSHNDE